MANVELNYQGGETVISPAGTNPALELLIERIAGMGGNPEDLATLIALAAEIAAARGGQPSVGARIGEIASYATPNAGGVIPGRYYDAAISATAGSVASRSSNLVMLNPFLSSFPINVDLIGVNVTTGQPTTLAKCFIYSSGPDGWPDRLLWQGTEDLDTSTEGFKYYDIPEKFLISQDTRYWLGVRINDATTRASFRCLNLASSVNFGLASGTSQHYNSLIARAIPFTTQLPDPWGFTPTDLAYNAPPISIRMRAS